MNHLLGPWRRRFQWLVSLVILLLPWGRIDQVSLLRIDIPSLSLHLFGATLRIEELYLLLIFSLAFVLFFLLVTLVFGRVWCGWACPQTTLSDFSEWSAAKLGLKINGYRIQGSAWRRGLLHLFYILLALLIGSNLAWYFVDPRTFFTQLFNLQLHPIVVGFVLIIAATIYLDMAFLRRMVCRDFCPYGRFQTVLVDPATLVLSLPEKEAPRCIKCGSCVRACPMEIDIRQGYQIECINCGRCLDACRQVMRKRGEPGLIGYHFGDDPRSWRGLLAPRTLVLAVGLIGLSVLLFFAVQLRAEATLKIALSHQVSSRRLTDGTQASFFNAWINNRTTRDQSYRLSARMLPANDPLELRGPTNTINLGPGQNQRIDFVLISPFREADLRVNFELHDQDGKQLASREARITSRQSR